MPQSIEANRPIFQLECPDFSGGKEGLTGGIPAWYFVLTVCEHKGCMVNLESLTKSVRETKPDWTDSKSPYYIEQRTKPLNTIFDRLRRGFSEKFPELGKALTLPRYQQPGGYSSYRFYEVGLYSAILNVMYGMTATDGRGDKLSPDITAPYYCTLSAYNHHFPLYWVSKDLTKAVREIEPPVGLTMEDVAWPLPVLTFLFPEGMMFGDEELFSITVVRGNAATEIVTDNSPFAKAGLPNIYFPQDFMSMWGLTINHQALREHNPLELIGNWYMNAPYEGNVKQFITERRTLHGTDLEAMSQIVFNLVLIMQSRPEYVEALSVNGVIKNKQTGAKETIYNPRWVGKNYHIVRDRTSSGGTHASPHAHWRRGHWREQAVGPRGLKQHKRILIDPIWVDPQ